MYQPELEGSGSTQYLFRTHGILHTWKLDHHTIFTLLLYQRLRNTQFVDTIFKRRNILRQSRFLFFHQRLLAIGHNNQRGIIFISRIKLKIPEFVFQQGNRFFSFRSIAKTNGQIVLVDLY